MTEFDYPVYKDVIITDKTGCNIETLSLPKVADLITIEIPSDATSGVDSPYEISTYIINTNPEESPDLCVLSLRFLDAVT